MLGEPLAQRPHRHRLARDPAFPDQEPADAPVRIAVLRGRSDAELAIAGKTQGAAAFDLHEEHVDRVPRPRDRACAAAKAALFDLGTTPAAWAVSHDEVVRNA